MTEGRLKDRVAVVTGGSSGIGRGVALRLAAEGASVVVADVQEEPREGGTPTHVAIEEAGGAATFVATDVADPEAARRCVDTAVSAFGALHIAFCGAGVTAPIADTTDIDAAAWERHLAINLTGSFLVAQAALRHLVPAGYGRIVFVSSTSGLVGVARTAAYCASKAGVIGLGRALAAEYGRHGITVNVLCPGATNTAMGLQYRSDPDVLEDMRRMTPLRLDGNGGIVAEPADIASAVAYMVSDEARFMTGSCMVVDGGLTTV
jgi:glucose 1-dehydrogenase